MSETEVLAGVTALAIGDRALLFEGSPGIGKSTLALALIDRGAVLIGDDGVTLQRQNRYVLASPPPTIAGKLEVRNVGIVEMPTGQAPVALVLNLTADAPRYPLETGVRELLGVVLPYLAFDPALAGAALRAEWALRQHGLRF